MENLYTFLGTKGVGKSHTVLMLSKLLSLLNKNVLTIDLSSDQGIYNYFEYNSDVEEEQALVKKSKIIREGFSMMVNNPLKNSYVIKFTQQEIKRFCEEYDFVFIKMDGIVDKYVLNNAKKIFLVQNSDKTMLLKNRELLKKLSLDGRKVTFIFNQLVEGIDDICLFNLLVSTLKYPLSISDDDILIEFMEQDVISAFHNKINGIISIKDYSGEFKNAMFDLINLITNINGKEFKKLIKNRRA